MPANPFDVEYRLLQADFANTILQAIEEAQTRREFVVLKPRERSALPLEIDFNMSLTGRTESKPNLQATPGNPFLDGTMDGERPLTMERLKEIMEPLMNYKPLRIISGAPLVGYKEVMHVAEANVFWIGAGVMEDIKNVAERHEALSGWPMGVEVEQFTPRRHGDLWGKHIFMNARCEVSDGR